MSNKKILVIVESPAKCNKIQNYLGPGYNVKASFGHICNLDTKKGLDAIDIQNHYKPKFINIKEKKKYIDDLKKHASNCDEVIIASDLDREGEATLLHLGPNRTATFCTWIHPPGVAAWAGARTTG